MRIHEQFTVRAPLERVWGYLIEPEEVVSCLPGAEITGKEGFRTHLGRVTVKVGPVTVTYNGRAHFSQVDEVQRLVVVDAHGKEKGGAGSAKLRMTSKVTSLPDGATEVRVIAEVDLAGKIVQFGRGMIETVSRQLFRQFAACVAERLEAKAELGAGSWELGEKPSEASPSVSAGVGGSPAAIAAPEQAVAAPAAPTLKPTPVRLIPLLARALWDMLLSYVRTFRRRS